MTSSLAALLALALAPAGVVDRGLPPGLLPESLDEAAWARLETDEVFVALAEVEGSAIREAVAVALVAAAPERVFKVVADLAHFAEFMPYVRASTVAPGPDGSVLNDQVLDLPLLEDRFYTIRVVSRREEAGGVPLWRSSWTLVPGSGNLRENRGSWTLVAYRAGTLVIYRVATDPGGWIPRWAHHLATRRSLPGLIAAVRARARDPRYD